MQDPYLPPGCRIQDIDGQDDPLDNMSFEEILELVDIKYIIEAEKEYTADTGEQPQGDKWDEFLEDYVWDLVGDGKITLPEIFNED